MFTQCVSQLKQFLGCHTEQLPDPNFLYDHLAETLTAGVPPIFDGPLPKDITVRNFHELIERVSRSYKEVNTDILAFMLLELMAYQKLTPGVLTSLYLQHELNFVMNNSVAAARLAYAEIGTALIWPHPQIVAEALAAATTNISLATGEDRFRDTVIPVFSFIGTWPCFYLIPITAAFSVAVARGEIPPHPTKIFYCPAPLEYEFYGMSLKDQRILILKMFEAFKQFIPTNFAQLCRFSGLEGDVIPKPLSPSYKTNVWDWAHRFLWECEEYYRRREINKFDYHSTNYCVRMRVQPATLIKTDNIIHSASSPPPIPLGYNSDFPDALPISP